MRVFVTGASGYIGSAIVAELLAAGHAVTGLARSETAVAAVTAAGATVHRGSLDDLDSLRGGAAAADGVIHTAFLSDLTRAIGADQRAIETLGAALTGADRPLVAAFGTVGLTPGHLATEQDAPDPTSVGGLRSQSEATMLDLASRGVRSAIVRLAPSVHGPGDHGFVKTLIDIAHAKGVSAYVGDGANRWPAVHRLDAAHLFCLALEQAPSGSRLHAVGDEGVPFRDIAGVIGRHLHLPVVSVPREEAYAHFGWLGAFVAADNPTSSALTQERLGWHPSHPGLLADLEEGDYFTSPGL